MKKNFLIFLFLLAVSIPSIISLFHPGFFQSDDGEWMIIRFSAFHQTLRDGQFPVRFLSRLNYGYGYPVANFLYPGFMYLAEIPKVLGFGFVPSVKIILGLSMIGSVVFSFLWLRQFFGKFEGFVGSLFYLYAPYHLFDLYKRGSVGEILALAIVPFILWQIERQSFFWTSIGIALLILSHNTLALLFLPIIILYMVLKIFKTKDRKRLIYRYTGILVIGLGLASFFWLPAIFDLGYTRFSQTQVSDWQNYFVDLNLIGWGTLLVFILCFLSALLRLRKRLQLRSNDLNHSIKFILFFLVGVGSIFLSLSQSNFLWQMFPVSFIQFPFRFLSVAILSVAFLAAYLLSILSGKTKIAASFVLLLFLIISVKQFLTPAQFFDKGEGFYATNEGTTTVRDEYLPKWVKEKPTGHFKEKVEVVSGEANINNLIFNSKKITFELNAVADSKIRINTLYFPGWKAVVDEKETIINHNNVQGVMDLLVSEGEHDIRFVFAETQLRLVSDIISFVSLFFLLGIILKRKDEIF